MNGYPAKLQVFAQRLHAKGYSLRRIQAACQRLGYSPSCDTVYYWVDAEYAKRRNAQRAARKRATDEEKRERAERERIQAERDHRDALLADLRKEGLSLEAVSIACRYFQGIHLTADQIRYRTTPLGPFPTGRGRTRVSSVPFRTVPVEELERTRELKALGLTHAAIGRQLGITAQAVGARLKKVGA